MKHIHAHKQLSKHYSYKQRKLIGAKVISFIDKIIKIENLSNIKWGTFYIVKENRNGYKKNQRTFDKPHNTKHRVITFIKDKELRNNLGFLASKMELPHSAQIGFTSNRGVKDIKIRNKPKKIWNIDLENAFGQIKYNHILFILNRTLTIKKSYAQIIAKSMTDNRGIMVQGHPLSPVMFNLLTFALINRINNIIEVKQYADDITIFSTYDWISYKFKRFIEKIFKEEGWVINPAKYNFNRKHCKILGLTLMFDQDWVMLANKASKNLRYLFANIHAKEGKELESFKSKIVWYAYKWDIRVAEKYANHIRRYKITRKLLV